VSDGRKVIEEEKIAAFLEVDSDTEVSEAGSDNVRLGRKTA